MWYTNLPKPKYFQVNLGRCSPKPRDGQPRPALQNLWKNFLPQLRRGSPIEMPCLLLLHCTAPLPIASACRQGNSGEKKNCSIFAPFSYFSQTLSVLFKHFSQFSSLSRMFPNPRLPLRLLNEEIMLLLFCLSTSFAHILFKFKPWFPRGVRIEEVFSNWQLNFQQMWKSETSEEGGMGGAVCG